MHLPTVSWPAARAGEAFAALIQRSRLAGPADPATPSLPANIDPADDQNLGQWLEALAAQYGLESEPVRVPYAELELFVRAGGPALVRVDDGADGMRFLALHRTRGGQAVLIGPDLIPYRLPIAAVVAAIAAPLVAPYTTVIDSLLTAAGTTPARQARAARLLLKDYLGTRAIRGCWLVRMPPSSSLWRQMRRSGFLRPLLVGLGSYMALLAATLGAWVLIGRNALSGQFSLAWVTAWALLLLTAIPFQMMVSRVISSLSVRSGMLFKQRLLLGITRLEPDQVRQDGAGRSFGRALDAEAVEQLGLTGGISAALALIQVAAAGLILAATAGSPLHGLLLALWLGGTLLLAWLYRHRAASWSDAYRGMTSDLVERMVGHRTRLVQEAKTTWHEEEDRQLQRYLHLSMQVDRAGLFLSGVVGRGWMLIALAALAVLLLTGPAQTAAAMPFQVPILLAAVILALQGLTTFSAGLRSLVNANLAWRQIAPLFKAAQQPTTAPALAASWFVQSRAHAGDAKAAPGGRQQILLQARDLSFRYQPQGRLVLSGCTLQIRAGDRLLLEGPSGGGKSTLAALLAGMRTPAAGLLLLRGMDMQAVGATTWRRCVVMAPQFHENHVFADSLAFNLLLGRRWPPEAADLAAAEALCYELGLGPLLEQMPAGLQQMVGESGWQLSHGERSRLFIARTLLQEADLVILDESFAALDPVNLQHTMRCVLQRAPSVLVIAHP